MTEHTYVTTAAGRLAVRDTGRSGPAIVFIHGNSSAKEAFAKQFDDPRLAGFRLTAIDLPGHGASDDAADPGATYTFPGYAACVAEACGALGLARPLLVGWSLGGHIALEMIGSGFDARGVMITGTPPIAPSLDSALQAFNIDPNAENLTGKRDFTEDDARAYATHLCAVDGAVDPHLSAMASRTDGRARETMFGSVVTGNALDEVEIVAGTNVPLAIVNGADDPFIRADYFDGLSYGSLWERGVVRLEGAAHAPFLQRPREFSALLAEFAGA